MSARRWWRRLWWCAALLWWVAPPVPAQTLLVTPFENGAGKAELDWVSESFSEALTTDLAGWGRTLRPREERLAALERLGLPPAGTLTRASLLRLAEELAADAVVFGRFEVDGGRLFVEARLLTLRDPSLSPPITVAGSFDKLLGVQDRLAWLLLRQLDPSFPLSLDAYEQRLPRLELSAFESYIRGLLAFDRQQQLRYLLQAAKLDPGYPAPALRLGHLYLEDSDHATATRWFAKVDPESPLGAEARFYLALCQFQTGELARARETLTALAESGAVNAAVWNNLGVAASRQGSEDAAGYYARALEQEPGAADVHFNLALDHARRQRWNDAAQELELVLERNPADTEAYFLRAQVLQALGRQDEARRARQQAVGDNPALDLALARRELNLDRLRESFRSGPATAAPPEASSRAHHVAAHLARGEDFLSRGELEAAREEFTQAVLLAPDSYAGHFFLAEIHQRQGQSAKAVSELKAALYNQESVPARLKLAELLLTENRTEEAREQVRAALGIDPSNPAARQLEVRLGAGSEAKPR
jgi:tetratricopeptide (TPR) repeat protein